jgi:hypothetical protein
MKKEDYYSRNHHSSFVCLSPSSTQAKRLFMKVHRPRPLRVLARRILYMSVPFTFYHQTSTMQHYVFNIVITNYMIPILQDVCLYNLTRDHYYSPTETTPSIAEPFYTRHASYLFLYDWQFLQVAYSCLSLSIYPLVCSLYFR